MIPTHGKNRLGLKEKNRLAGYKGQEHRNVENDITSFCGWARLETLVGTAQRNTKLLVLSLFKTGARANEVLTLRRDQINIVRGFVHVSNMPVLKSHTRDIPKRSPTVYIKEPLTDEWLDLMPASGPFFSFKYNTLYRRIADLEKTKGETHGPWWPHRFRAERARQLVQDYVLDGLALKKWFSWTRDKSVKQYADPSIRQIEDRILVSGMHA